jgi:hypothetical protein
VGREKNKRRGHDRIDISLWFKTEAIPALTSNNLYFLKVYVNSVNKQYIYVRNKDLKITKVS